MSRQSRWRAVDVPWPSRRDRRDVATGATCCAGTCGPESAAEALCKWGYCHVCGAALFSSTWSALTCFASRRAASHRVDSQILIDAGIVTRIRNERCFLLNPVEEARPFFIISICYALSCFICSDLSAGAAASPGLPSVCMYEPCGRQLLRFYARKYTLIKYNAL